MRGAVDGGTGGATSRTLTQTIANISNCKFKFWKSKVKWQATTFGFRYTTLCGM